MRHALLEPLYQAMVQAPPVSPDEASAANIVAWQLLRAPYFELSYAHWVLLARPEGHIRLARGNHDGDMVCMDPAEPFYQEAWEDGQALVRPRFDIASAQPTSPEQLPAHLLELASRRLDQVSGIDPAFVQKLMHPTASQMKARHALSIEEVMAQDLNERLAGLLGDAYYHDANLRSLGIDFHTAPSYDHGGIYLLATNGHEVAGILAISDHRPWSYGVRYLSVAPGFRRRGLGKALFSRAIEKCIQDQRVMVRTQPSEFASSHPGITSGFDRLACNAPLLHVASNSAFMQVVGKAMQAHGYQATCMKALGPLCEEAMRQSRLYPSSDFMQKVEQAIDAIVSSSPRSSFGKR